jgi:hypothetical protein
MNIDDFEIPTDDGDYPITPAEEILRQTRRALNTGECVVYSIYSANSLATTLNEATQLLIDINAFTESLMSAYIWSRECFSLHVIEDTFTDEEQKQKQTYFFLQGCTIYADCIDDEWFVVYLLHKISLHFPDVYIRIGDRDGEFLLIEAADVLPRWIQPENAANRVWIRAGYVHLLSGDGLGTSADGEGIDHTAARSVMMGTAGAEAGAAAAGAAVSGTEAASAGSDRKGCSVYKDVAVSNSIVQRIAVFPEQHLACQHTADVILPRKCAAVLAKYPSILSTAVSTLCDGEEATKKDMADMSCVGASDFVSISVVFTRIQYAQLMFQNLEPPPLLRLAEKRMDFKDKNTVKAFDVGMRLACGTEAVYHKARRLRSELQAWQREHSNLSYKYRNYLGEDALSEYIQAFNMRSLNGVEDSIHNLVNGSSSNSEGTSDQTDADLFHAIKPHGALPSTSETGAGAGGKGESDSWLYLTPAAMDKELADRVNVLKGQPSAPATTTPASASATATTAPISASSPVPPGVGVAEVEPLDRVVKGLEHFLAGESGVDGVDVDGAHDSDYFSDGSDTDSSSSNGSGSGGSDSDDGTNAGTNDGTNAGTNDGTNAGAMEETLPPLPPPGEVGSLAEEEGDIVLNLDKLMYILEEYQAMASGKNSKTNNNNNSNSNSKKKKKKQRKSSKQRAVPTTDKDTIDASTDHTTTTTTTTTTTATASVLSGTALHTLTHTLPPTPTRPHKISSASGLCTVEDAEVGDSDRDSDSNSNNDSGSSGSGSQADSDDASSGEEEGEEVSDDVFYKEYQDAMDSELSGTTLEESFLRQKADPGGGGGGKAVKLAASAGEDAQAQASPGEGAEAGAGAGGAVDEELNMLTHLLESHASQFGSNGPVGNLLGSMGISLPSTDFSAAVAEENDD